MKSLLIIGWVWPEPNSSAAGSRMVQLIRLFQTLDYQVTFVSAANTSDHMIDLAALDVAAQEITLNCDSFDAFVSELAPDAVMYDRYMVEEQFGWRVAKNCPNALQILDTEDLQSLRNARHQAFKQDGHLDNTELNTELAIREVAAIYRCDLTIMISPVEIALLVEHYQVPASHLCYLPFLHDEEALSQPSLPYTQRDNFIVIGNFRHAPNWDSVLWLKQQIWPQIRQALPQAELHIYGAYPPKKATDLHCEKSGFLVKGWAEDAFEVMAKAKVCLAPLRFGAGIKGKLSDAMLCSTPSVTTAIGAEGMTTELGWAGEVAETVDGLAQAAIALYQNEDKWQIASELAERNRKLLFTSQPFVDQFSEQLTCIANQLTMHRQQNFIGLMLNHHSHKSTQYMSQWIAAKNQLIN
ncbi:glycosyltransferase [Thalassotalea euphylliae]|uniref:Glycosyltransferase n=1 Tax=Thalassotalea euphylliae TaxID=1655234 RepID=A0A3E0U4X5_9GAMM|nr:glycosyltransferase [Thalassotalea euphylliae]REL31603.1 glycosyltransferase [Thalassotalea euphylliae]